MPSPLPQFIPPSADQGNLRGNLIDIIQRLSFARDLPSVTAIVSESAKRVLGCDGATFVLRDGEQVYYVDERAISPLWKGQRFSIDACVSGWCIRHRATVVIPDVYTDGRVPIDAYRPTFVKSLLMVPIRKADPLGAVGAYWRNPHTAEATEIATLQALADTAAIALSNVELFQERVRVEERLRESEQRFRAIAEGSPVGIAIAHKTDGRILYVNDQFSRMLGGRQEDFLSRPSTDLYADPHDRGRLLSLLSHTSLLQDVELKLKRLDGRPLWVCASVHALEVDHAPSLLFAFVDIARRKQAEEALLQKQRELRGLAFELKRVEDKERRHLAAALHDQLAQVLALCQLKLANAKPQNTRQVLSEIRTYIDEALRATRALMSDLRPLLLGQAGDLSTAIAWVVGKLERHGLRVTVREEPTNAALDDETLRLAYESIHELLFNVLKHAGTTQASLSVCTAQDSLEIVVEDRGRGFDPREARVPSSQGGFGLFSLRERLAVVNGQLDIESSVGTGTTAKVVLPLQRRAPFPHTQTRDRSAVRHVASNGGHRRIRVLLADDHQMMVEGLRHVIRSESDMEVIGEAADGTMAVELARTLAPDVIIMDVNMPRLNGIEATRLIKDENPRARVVALSSHVEPNIAAAMKEAGASAYLAKADACRSLCDTIR